ncbi:OsmC family protein [Bacillus fonticola]|uniref:OsmC family protein n=1 Tax=Bacillus fonticola TaxID=2728853 RepID=UPI0014726F93|nr:OsmC family protein [Bacillus fonticola]
MKFTLTDQGGFQTDLSFGNLRVSGNEELGFRPYQLMVSSIAVCSGGVLKKVLEKQRLVVKDLTVDADVTRSEDAVNRIEKIHLHYTLTGDLPEVKVQKAVELARKNCSMTQSVIGSIDIIETFTIKHPV